MNQINELYEAVLTMNALLVGAELVVDEGQGQVVIFDLTTWEIIGAGPSLDAAVQAAQVEVEATLQRRAA